MQIVLILGADGAAFAGDLAALLEPAEELTVIAPTVRAHFSAGLQASPDLDALLAPPASNITSVVADSLELVGFTPRWQRASDQAIAARLIRTDLARSGTPLTDATIAAAIRAALPYRVLPMCEGRAEFRVVVGADDPRAIHVDEYLDDPVSHEATQLLLIADQISISSAVSRALSDANVLVLGPSSRALVIDPVLRTPGFLELVDGLPVLVVDHADTAPADLIRVAGLSQPNPGRAESAPADAASVLARAREVAT